jgi:hypothetical protein
MKRYGWIRINGVYFIYDHFEHRIPLGYGYRQFKTFAEVNREIFELNKKEEG